MAVDLRMLIDFFIISSTRSSGMSCWTSTSHHETAIKSMNWFIRWHQAAQESILLTASKYTSSKASPSCSLGDVLCWGSSLGLQFTNDFMAASFSCKVARWKFCRLESQSSSGGMPAMNSSISFCHRGICVLIGPASWSVSACAVRGCSVERVTRDESLKGLDLGLDVDLDVDLDVNVVEAGPLRGRFRPV